MSAPIVSPIANPVAASPEIPPGLVQALTSAYAKLLKQQRSASSAYVRWTTAHSRAHEFAWMIPGQERILTSGQVLNVAADSPVRDSLNKMMSTIQLNPYERELVYGYPYVIGQVDGKPIRAPLLVIPITIETNGGAVTVRPTEEIARFNSLPFRSDFDSSAHELALSRLIESAPEPPINIDVLSKFVASVCRELGIASTARLDGILDAPPREPKAGMSLTIVDNAACFIAPKTSYFLVSDLQTIGKSELETVIGTAFGWLIGKRPPEPSSDMFEDRRKVFYPFPSNPSQRRVAHLVDDPSSRITVIQGPPGTGKSLTIANLACHLIAKGKRVLITSQKDKALQVVDELLNTLGFAQLPMTLLRQDRESKQELRERLQRIQKDRSAAEARADLEKQTAAFAGIAEQQDTETTLLINALMAEHEVHRAERAVKEAPGSISRLIHKLKLIRTLRAAQHKTPQRSDHLGNAITSTRNEMLQQAVALLGKAAEYRTCDATKTERNQLREFSKLLGRSQTNFKNYHVFDRMKSDHERCAMLMKVLPCWIMTPDDVARLFPCQPGVFDVVIIDEASQCDLPSMVPVLFRANQAVIAGDSKQMQAQRFAFVANQVAAQAWAEQGLDRLDPDKWLDPAKVDLLQLSSIRMDEEAFLDEHYRSLPQIINFSNERWYGGRLRIMRDSDDKRVGDPEAPVTVLHRVKGHVEPGTQENEIEARELVSFLRSLIDHPGYADASFGVICLFEEQMRLINDLVTEEIPEDLRVEHELVIVNPDGFQGDERDVILYSLSYDADGMSQAALSARQSAREHIQGMLNVAFTRARDEVHAFHSADVNDFVMSDKSGVIRDWLQHCFKYSSGPNQSNSNQLRKAQSDFEGQVLAALENHGVKVIAQYPSCGYFIDIVAEHNGIRIAIECDGEIWHLDEHGKLRVEDLQRQEVLERAGWRVLRIPYRSWRENSQVEVQKILQEFIATEEPPADPPQAQTQPDNTRATPPPKVLVDKVELAIISALNNGNRSKDEVFKSARQGMGYSRLGNQIRSNLELALQRLESRNIIRLEEDEVFFQNDQVRNSAYDLAGPFSISGRYGSTYQNFRRRPYRRYRKY